MVRLFDRNAFPGWLGTARNARWLTGTGNGFTACGGMGGRRIKTKVSYKGNLLLIKLKRSRGRKETTTIVGKRRKKKKKRVRDRLAVKIKFPLNGNKTVTSSAARVGCTKIKHVVTSLSRHKTPWNCQSKVASLSKRP